MLTVVFRITTRPLLDEQRTGPAYLRMPAIAEVVADAIGQGMASLLHA